MYTTLRAAKENPLIMQKLLVEILDNELMLFSRGEIPAEQLSAGRKYNLDEIGFNNGGRGSKASTYRSLIERPIIRTISEEKNDYKVTSMITSRSDGFVPTQFSKECGAMPVLLIHDNPSKRWNKN